MAYTYNTTLLLGTTQTGLSLKAALRDTSGVIHATLRDITTGFIEDGSGIYSWVTSSMPNGYRGSVVFYVGTLGAAVDFTGVTLKIASNIAPQEGEVASVGDQMSLIDGAISEAKITTPVEIAGRPIGILAMIRRLFERQPGGNKQNRDRSTGTVTLRNELDSATIETHTQSTSGTVDTQSKGA